MGLIHSLNYAVPIVTVPVVARALGPSTYGILATFYAYAAYAGVLTVFGFNVTGPRAIAGLHDDDVHTLSRIVFTIVAAQALLGAAAVAVSYAALSVIPYGDEYRTVGLVVLMHTFSGSMLRAMGFHRIATDPESGAHPIDHPVVRCRDHIV